MGHLLCASALSLWGTQKMLRPGFCSHGARTSFLNIDLFITSVLAQDARIKYHRLGGLNSSSGGWKSEVMQSEGPAWLVLVRALFLACRQLPSCHILTWQREEALFSSYKGTNPFMGSPPS